MRSLSFIWRRIQLRLSVDHHWTRRHDGHILSVCRTQRRFFQSRDNVSRIEQIPVDSSTRLLSPTSRDLRRLRFSLLCSNTRYCFQAPHDVAYEKWRLTIAAAIGEAEEMEQKLQMSKTYSVDAHKDYHVGIYTRDASNYKLIRLHPPRI
ncbi:Pleckstrin homology-like domain [Plasmopara halstedii]|uniref:Pleckstrin homology-like domain n=1 Tax=Plasmopara halstedii TaxID=4781 RepID=A0A0P1AG52_PLAHL|nr:Pleckstrin homology-like domain [Plasmopara halstedii]CEG39620.1 Pleckstrin homology-like domain [Plasmopara halstedii]|eukprot:XP_024575989.1 Pleckstrin homology-like domain [Plasmopara halstedii]